MKLLPCLFGFCFLFACCGSLAAAPRVELQLVTEEGFPITGAHEWLAALKPLEGVTIRIRSARSGDTIQISKEGSEEAPLYVVTGLLTSSNKLRLPGGTFSQSDIAGLKSWLARVQGEGSDGVTAPRGAFGLTAQQLLDTHDALAVPVDFSTKGKKAVDVARQIAAGIAVKVSASPTASAALKADYPLADELLGVSSGTALAAAVRPLGLVVSLQKPVDGDLSLLVADVREAKETWPVGWPVESTKDVLPKYLEFLNVEIEDTPLPEALAAIGGRLEVPILFDHNALARQRIDPAAVSVTLPQGRTYYKKVVDRLLSQGKLKAEVRVDEAGSPLLWVTTIQK